MTAARAARRSLSWRPGSSSSLVGRSPGTWQPPSSPVRVARRFASPRSTCRVGRPPTASLIWPSFLAGVASGSLRGTSTSPLGSPGRSKRPISPLRSSLGPPIAAS
eukprot:11974967-Alexandrium_andersonii.AAC.1